MSDKQERISQFRLQLKWRTQKLLFKSFCGGVRGGAFFKKLPSRIPQRARNTDKPSALHRLHHRLNLINSGSVDADIVTARLDYHVDAERVLDGLSAAITHFCNRWDICCVYCVEHCGVGAGQAVAIPDGGEVDEGQLIGSCAAATVEGDDGVGDIVGVGGAVYDDFTAEGGCKRVEGIAYGRE